MEKTVDSNKIQYPLHHIKTHRTFSRNAQFSQAQSHCLLIKKHTSRKLDKLSSTSVKISSLLQWTVGPSCLNQARRCLGAKATPDVTSYVKMSFACSPCKPPSIPSKNHMKRDHSEVSSKVKGSNLAASIANCRSAFSAVQNIVRFLRQCTWASSLSPWTMWNNVLQSVVGGCSRWLSQEGKEAPLFSTFLL